MSSCTLVISQSNDVTAELLLDKLDRLGERYFRLNFDLWASYKVNVSPDSFRVSDPVGRQIDLPTTAKAYFRKPSRNLKGDSLPRPVVDEMWECLRALVRLLWRRNKLVLVEPFCESFRLDKLAQLELAARFFRVPRTSFASGEMPADHEDRTVIKSMVRDWSPTEGIFTTMVELDKLNPRFCWFIQDLVDASYDLTVVYVRGQQFAFAIQRSFLASSVDWRTQETMGSGGQQLDWRRVHLGAELERQIEGFMAAADLHFGRLDFLWDGAEILHFCEVNPNGQFAWLDVDDQNGLLSAVAKEIAPSTALSPIPFSPFRNWH